MAIALTNWPALGSMPGMDEAEFARWVSLLEKRTGVVVPTERKAFLVSSLRTRMRETRHGSFEDYYRDVLDGPRGAIEWATLVDRLTVHETRFFRHPPSLDLIGKDWLPARLAAGLEGSLHAWSIGCASGEEAYSLAMVLDRGYASVPEDKRYFGVTATDVSQAALAIGTSGIYPVRRIAEIPDEFRDDYCRPLDEESFVIREGLRRRVGFARFNLLDVARAPLKRLDLIYCQNVLMYFARERRRELVVALVGLLKPGGLLVLGAGEVTNFTPAGVSRVENRQVLAFQRNG